MYCSVCRGANIASPSNKAKANAFASGTMNFQHSAVVKHAKSGDHNDALKAEGRRQDMEQAAEKAEGISATALFAQMGAAMLLATGDLADTHLDTLIHAQKLGGSKVYEKASPYTRHTVVQEMQEDLAAVCMEKTMARIKNSPFVGIMVDESIDIAVQKELVIFCKIAHCGKSKIEFGANTEVKDGKANTIVTAILSFLEEHDIDLSCVTGLGTDGAQVMLGVNEGVATQLKRQIPRLVSTWCVAHRIALVAHWAAQKVEYLKTVQSTLVDVYKYFQFSAVRYNKLRELKALMNAQVKKFRKPTSVRWLSLQESVSALISAWGVLVLTLEHEGAGNSVGAAQARGILSKVKTFKFIATLHVLSDALEAICKCNRVFQKDVLNIVEVDNMLKATLDTVLDLAETPGPDTQNFLGILGESDNVFQGIQLNPTDSDLDQLKNLATTFGSNVKVETEKRFPASDMQTMKDFATVLNPQKLPEKRDASFPEYGKAELNRLLDKYGGNEMGIDSDVAKRSFSQFKNYLTNHRESDLPGMCRTLIMDDTFPVFSRLAQISLTLPLTSVPCERGFSAQNRVHTPLRNALTVQSINNKLAIAHEAKQEGFAECEVIEEASGRFKSRRKRNPARTGE